jgi:drug/metabolite transporter (DMT)-like permease
MMGLAAVITTSFATSITIVTTRYLEKIHFTLIMFHYALIASCVFFIYMLIEYISQPSSFPDGFRLFTYDIEQWKLLALMAVFNTIEINFGCFAY